jgi:hypothetical protein
MISAMLKYVILFMLILAVMEMIQGEYVENVKIMSAEIQNGKLSKKLDSCVTTGESVSNSDSLKAIKKTCKYTRPTQLTCSDIQLTFIHFYHFCLIISPLKLILQ